MSIDEADSVPRIVVRDNPQQQTRNKVIDIHSWFLAWSLFFQASVIFRAHLAGKLEKYQTFIAQLAANYSFSSWYGYDQAFRLFIANNPLTGNRDVCNEDIYNTHLKEAPEVLNAFRAEVGIILHLFVLGALVRDRRYPPVVHFHTQEPRPISQSAPFLDPQHARFATQSSEHCNRTTFASARTRAVGESTVASDVVSLIQPHNEFFQTVSCPLCQRPPFLSFHLLLHALTFPLSIFS